MKEFLIVREYDVEKLNNRINYAIGFINSILMSDEKLTERNCKQKLKHLKKILLGQE